MEDTHKKKECVGCGEECDDPNYGDLCEPCWLHEHFGSFGGYAKAARKEQKERKTKINPSIS